MRFSFAYKTSDGIRHEDTIDAPSRADAFAQLRARGIRPIKVVASDGSKANGETRFVTRKRVVFAALALGLAFGIGLAVYIPRVSNDISRIGRYREGMSEKIDALRDSADAILKSHDEHVAAAVLAPLADYDAIYAATNDAACAAAIRLGYQDLNEARRRLRDVFRPLYDIFPADCVNERTDAQRLYAEAMDRLDTSEARFLRAEKAYRLLVSHRGKWIAKKGVVVFTDSKAADEFAYLQRGPDTAAARWTRDFEQ